MHASHAPSDDIAALRALVTRLEPLALAPGRAPVAFGHAPLDTLLGGGLERGALHEMVPSAHADLASATGFVLGLCQRTVDCEESGMPRAPLVVWIRQAMGERETGKLYPPGLTAMGFSPAELVHLRLKDTAQVLRAGIEAARCSALDAVVVEPWGEPAVLDLTATRRLALAAETSGVPIFLLRADPKRSASAARTRWRIKTLPSRRLEANAPGLPAFEITLARHRQGAAGVSFRLEWNHAERRFAHRTLLRPVVSHPADRPAAAPARAPWRRAG